jgi:phage tail sheath protein FI
MTFTGVLESIGKGFEKGLSWAVQYAVPVEKLVGTLFPATAPVSAGIADATSLVQNAILLVEQKYAASGLQSGTGPQKLAEVTLLAGPVVTQLLSQAGVSISTAYVQSLVSAVVAILNVQPMPAAKAA